MKLKFIGSTVCAMALLASVYAAEKNLLPDNPDKAWQEVEEASKPPTVPEEWAGKTPNEEQRDVFQAMLGERSVVAASKAHEFYTRFPTHPKASEAKDQEKRFVQQALSFGVSDLPKFLESSMTEEERIAQKLNYVNRRAMAKQPQGLAAVIKEFEGGIRSLMKEFPKNGLLWSQLLIVAQNSDDKAQKEKILNEIASSDVADPEVKDRAKGMLRAFAAIGRPLEMSFTATDGSKVEIQKMKGKVILLDFWASWCGPCIVSLPDLIELYQTHHDKGLEILGINMDKTRPAMDAAIERFQIPWRQYFDGRGWGNKFALEYNVGSIPSMWLVDKKGILRTMEAREDLETQVKDLLAETEKL